VKIGNSTKLTNSCVINYTAIGTSPQHDNINYNCILSGT